MEKKLAIITIHGMGETPGDYWIPLKRALEEDLGAEAWEAVSFQPIFYQRLIQEHQYRVWGEMPLDRLDGHKLRKFLLFSFSDAATLEHKAGEAASPYVKAQRVILDALEAALEEVASPKVPVVLIGHSLGCQVLSNFIWDCDRGKGIWKHIDSSAWSSTELRFLKLRTKRYFFSTGCNIPIFVSGFKQIKAFRKTPANFEWYNYFDEDDVLGWPLRTLSDSYRNVVTQDVQINAGGWFTGWNPLSHTQYWEDKNFLAPVTRRIAQLLSA